MATPTKSTTPAKPTDASKLVAQQEQKQVNVEKPATPIKQQPSTHELAESKAPRTYSGSPPEGLTNFQQPKPTEKKQ